MQTEVPVPNIGGRIDILARDKNSSRDVLIELKIENRNPTKQLIAYGSQYSNPILIGISTKKFSDTGNMGILHYTYNELGITEPLPPEVGGMITVADELGNYVSFEMAKEVSV